MDQLTAGVRSQYVNAWKRHLGQMPVPSTQHDPIESLFAAGYKVETFGPDIPNNRFTIGIQGLSSSSIPSVQAIWNASGADLTADLVDFVPATDLNNTGNASCTPTSCREDSPGQVKAGMHIMLQHPSGVDHCTSNMFAYDTHYVAYGITAGHCTGTSSNGGYGQPVIAQMIGPTNTVGTVDFNANTYGSAADALRWRVTNDTNASTLVHTVGSCGGVRCVNNEYIASFAPNTEDKVGDLVCYEGWTTDWTLCGYISSIHQSVNGLIDQRYVASYFNYQPGDSGGLVRTYNEAKGINVGYFYQGSTKINVFSGIANAVQMLMLSTPITSDQIVHWPGLMSLYSNMCMDIQWNNQTNGTTIWQYPCNFNPAQLWYLVPTGNEEEYWIKNIQGKCLDLDISQPGGGYSPGNRVQLWDCNGYANQRWHVSRRLVGAGSQFRIWSPYSIQDLDVRGPTTAQGAVFQQWPYISEYQLNQMFSLAQ